MLKIEFEEPEYGWLPVKICFEDIEEIFDASDVPINPVSQLEEVLDSAITGYGGEVWWHLEPAGYYLSIHAEKGLYRLKLEFSKESMKDDREGIFEYTGDFENVIVPIWRSLRKLQSYDWSEFKVSPCAMRSITDKVKSLQQE